jgi:anti-sigma B factor antagonist
MPGELDGQSATTSEITILVAHLISVAHHDEIVVLTVGGDIDLSTAATLETAIDAALIGSPMALIVDLSAVEILGSAGLRVLGAAKEKVAIPRRFAVVASSPATRRPIELTDLDQVFSMYQTLDDAVRSLRDGTPK